MRLVIRVLVGTAALAVSYIVLAVASNLTPISDDEYAVYAAAVEAYFGADNPPHVSPLYIADNVNQYPGSEELGPWLKAILHPDLPSSMGNIGFGTAFQFRARGLLRRRLQDRLDLKYAYELVTKEHTEAFEQDASHWKPYVSFSRVGFSLDGNTAVVGVNYVCGLCGGSDLLVLRRYGRRWQVVRDRNTVSFDL